MAGSRLLVPIVAAVAGAAAEVQDAAVSEKASEMSIPTLIGHDGRGGSRVYQPGLAAALAPGRAPGADCGR